ncbi:MAG: Drug resistance transporter, EmrB/QacA subfamilyprotein [Acidimicrobiaceae bacterium]|nr:Drug resistance transporter, EmrB/QacA subfamilyprotein [Acidimicrobiaceae bacterium]
MTDAPIKSNLVGAANDGPDPKRWSVLLVVVIAQLMVVLDASIVTIALPSAQRDLHFSVANRQWVITAYSLAFGGLLLLGGRIADFAGRRRIFIVGLIGFAAASALGGVAVDQAMLFGSRALQGAAAALMAPGALSILTNTFQDNPGERAKAFGAYGAVGGAGAAIGVLAGGVLTEFASWRWCFLINVPIALLTAFAASRVVRETRSTGKTGYDIPGAVLVTAGIVSLVYGFTKAVADGWTSATTLSFTFIGVILLIAFVVVESRSAFPLLPLRVVLERNRGGAFLATLLIVVGMFAMFLFVSYYMQQILHYSAAKSGVAFLPFALGVIVAAGLATPLVPKIGPRAVMTSGLLIAAAGMLWLTQISYWTHLLPQLIVMSIGMGLAFPALSSTALTKVNPEDSGVASSLLNASQQVGASLGAALLNTIAATATASYIASRGAGFLERGTVHGFAVAFAVGAAILAAGAIVSAALVQGNAHAYPASVTASATGIQP